MRSLFGFRVSSFEFRVSNFLSRHSMLLALLAVAAIGLMLPARAAAQGCAMCYTSAAASKKAGLQALQSGILILGVPPLAMFIGIFLYVFRRRDRSNETGFGDDRGRDEMPSAPPRPLPGGLGEEPEELLAVTGWPGDRGHSENSIPSGRGR